MHACTHIDMFLYRCRYLRTYTLRMYSPSGIHKPPRGPRPALRSGVHQPRCTALRRRGACGAARRGGAGAAWRNLSPQLTWGQGLRGWPIFFEARYLCCLAHLPSGASSAVGQTIRIAQMRPSSQPCTQSLKEWLPKLMYLTELNPGQTKLHSQRPTTN